MKIAFSCNYYNFKPVSHLFIVSPHFREPKKNWKFKFIFYLLQKKKVKRSCIDYKKFHGAPADQNKLRYFYSRDESIHRDLILKGVMLFIIVKPLHLSLPPWREINEGLKNEQHRISPLKFLTNQCTRIQFI